VKIHRGGTTIVPEHLSKDQDIAVRAGDRVEVLTPGGGGYGDPLKRDPSEIARDVARGYYTADEAEALVERRAVPRRDGRRRRDGSPTVCPPPANGVRARPWCSTSVRPRSTSPRIRAEREVSILAGGTDIYPARANRPAWGDPAHADVLDIGAIPGLRRHRGDRGRRPLRRADVTWSALAGAALPPEFDGYRAAAREVGGRQVQNRATLVGNLVTASPAGDGIPNLMALDAVVELQSRSGRREVPVAAFIDRYRHTCTAARTRS
jgi:hypothetical protein